MGMDYSGVIVSTDRNTLEKVYKSYFAWTSDVAGVQEFTRNARIEGEVGKPLYAIYYSWLRIGPDYRRGPEVIKMLEKVPWKWDAFCWDYHTCQDDVQEAHNELWSALDLDEYAAEPCLDVERTTTVELCTN